MRSNVYQAKLNAYKYGNSAEITFEVKNRPYSFRKINRRFQIYQMEIPRKWTFQSPLVPLTHIAYVHILYKQK